MEFKKLFATQKVLMDRIEKEHPPFKHEHRSSKRLLALLVEIGECANEQRSWKFWSKDQEPRTKGKCKMCDDHIHFVGGCPMCNGTGWDEAKNPLLEELVDGLHFVLEEGLEWNVVDYDNLENLHYPDVTVTNIADWFIDFYRAAIVFYESERPTKWQYRQLMSEFLYLASALGFTWEEVTESYYQKNKVNHTRQDNNY